MGHLILVQDKTEKVQVKWLFFKSWYIIIPITGGVILPAVLSCELPCEI